MEQGLKIRTVILLWLLLSGVTFTNAQQISTVGEIYNYNVGDIFHFSFWASAPQGGASSITNIEIINKTYSSGNDTLYYDRSIAYHRTYPDPIIEYYVDTVLYTDLDSLIRMGNIDTVYTDPNLYNGRKINYLSYGTSSDVWAFEYVDGCGKARVYFSNWTSIYSEDELMYYKKGDEEWGTPITVGIDEAYTEPLSISTYPNPFTTSTTIEYELTEPSHVQLTIYNAIGETIYVAEDRIMPQGKHSFTWTADRLPQGMYYAVLRSEEGVSVVKMVKQ